MLMMNMTKDKIRKWLAAKGRDREWLAQQCGASKGTVDQWFYRGFSDSALATIDKLMQLDELQSSQATDETGLIQFSTAEFEEIERARAAVGNPTRPQFYRDAILQYVEDLNAETSGESSQP